MRFISKNAFALLLCGAFLVPTVLVSAPARADVSVDLHFWGTPEDYQIWCAENYPSCVPWGELPGTWRYRYRDWWEGRHHGEHWGRHERHEREHEREHEHEHEHEH